MNVLRLQREWLDEHPGQAFDETGIANIMFEPVFRFDEVARERIVALEYAIGKLPQYECPLRHYFVDGIYVREISIPAGCVLVGYVHTQPCVTILSKGTILISEGDQTVKLSAPYTATVAAGSKKAGYALEDSIWSDCYVNLDNERDIEKLEARLTAENHEVFLARRELMLKGEA